MVNESYFKTSLVNDALLMAVKRRNPKKGDCWDNAVAESFFHSLKTELVHHEKFLTRKEDKRNCYD